MRPHYCTILQYLLWKDIQIDTSRIAYAEVDWYSFFIDRFWIIHTSETLYGLGKNGARRTFYTRKCESSSLAFFLPFSLRISLFSPSFPLSHTVHNITLYMVQERVKSLSETSSSQGYISISSSFLTLGCVTNLVRHCLRMVLPAHLVRREVKMERERKLFFLSLRSLIY